MLLEKLVGVGIPVEDPLDFYASGDPKPFIRQYLTNRYVGRCKDGCIIIRIGDIKRVSHCVIQSTNLEANGTVNVEFVAVVSSLGDGDIVTAVVVTRLPRNVGGISRNGGGLATILTPTPGLEAIRTGDSIPVRIQGKAMYENDSDRCQARSEILTAKRAPMQYVVEGAFTPEDAKVLERLAGWVRALLAERASAVPAEAVAFFEDLLFPAAGADPAGLGVWGDGKEAPPSAAGVDVGSGWAAVDALAVVAKAAAGAAVDVGGVWRRAPSLPASCTFAAKRPAEPAAAAPAEEGAGEAAAVSPATPASPVSPAQITPLELVEIVLHEAYNYLKAINELALEYPDDAAREKAGHVWGIMRAAQKPRS